MLGFKLFNRAGATGHVFLFGGTKVANKGLAFSGLIGPLTTVAVVPTVAQIINFAIDAQTKDKQGVTVCGTITIVLDPAKAVSRFDFTVNTNTGGYLGNWNQMLSSKVVEQVLPAVLAQSKRLDIATAIGSQNEIEAAVTTALSNKFSADGITIVSCSIPKIEPQDDEVSGAIGAEERQTMLAAGDKALHDRRIKAAENDRNVRLYESETARTLETERAKLIEQQGANKKAEAAAEAEATRVKLAPLQEIDAGKLLAAGILDAAKSGRLGSINLTSEFLAAVGK